MLYIQCHVTDLDVSMFNDMAEGAMCQVYFTLPHVTWQAAMLVRCILYGTWKVMCSIQAVICQITYKIPIQYKLK